MVCKGGRKQERELARGGEGGPSGRSEREGESAYRRREPWRAGSGVVPGKTGRAGKAKSASGGMRGREAPRR